MAKPQKARPIRLDQFRKQLEDSGVNDLQEIQLGPGDDDKVFVRLGFDVDSEKLEEFMNRVNAAEDSESAALVILDYHDELTAEDQLARVRESDYSFAELVAAWGSATGELRERMGKIKPRRS